MYQHIKYFITSKKVVLNFTTIIDFCTSPAKRYYDGSSMSSVFPPVGVHRSKNLAAEQFGPQSV